jgi:membrane protein
MLPPGMMPPGTRPSLLDRLERRFGSAIDSLYHALAENRITHLPWAVIQTFSRAHGALLSGSIAYYTFLSLLPLVLVTAFVLGTVSNVNAGAQDVLGRAFEQLLPGIEGREIIEQLINSRGAFGILGVVTTVYAGTGFVGSLTAGLNRIWDVSAGRNPLGQKLVNLFIVLMLGVVLLGSVSVTIWVAYLTRIALGEGAGSATRTIEIVASPLSLFVVLLALYRFLPARRLTLKSQVPGAVMGALGIEALKRAFTFWAQHSAGVAALPRTLLSVVLLLIWLGFFSQIVLYGAALNVVLERRRNGIPLAPPPSPPGTDRGVGSRAAT